ncbi:MAG: acylneuraminate cytidylyltransferase family protein [Thermodesulfobacteriota bacterium]|nr:acylneuraminate cytidylyltransferase family protein [Thermodesulfobacteriota bacterium]
MDQKTVLGLIPARGGSKGILRKNIRALCGRPLLTYTVEAALKAQSLDRVIVSTDDSEIAHIAAAAGAETPFFRPPEYSTDTATCILAIKHAIAWLEDNENYHPDAVAFLPPTSPLRTAEQIDGTVNLLWSSGMDSAVTVCPVQDHPYYVYSIDDNLLLNELIAVHNKPKRRQELPVYYAQSQSVMVSLTSYLTICGDSDLERNPYSSAGFVIDRESAFDVDTPIDFVILEAIMRQRMGRDDHCHVREE